MSLPTMTPVRPPLSRAASGFNQPTPLATSAIFHDETSPTESNALEAVLELSDGTSCRGISFGAEGRSVAGECVFQTGAFMLPALH